MSGAAPPSGPPRPSAKYRDRVARTSSKTDSPKTGRLSGRFWKLLGASTDKDQARSMAQVHKAAEFDAKAADLDDEQLRKAARLLELDDLADSTDVPQFLAIAREAAKRTTGLTPFDVQLQGALRMLAGDVVEMATGEGKTLSGAIAAAGYALAGRNVHVITINDYLFICSAIESFQTDPQFLSGKGCTYFFKMWAASKTSSFLSKISILMLASFKMLPKTFQYTCFLVRSCAGRRNGMKLCTKKRPKIKRAGLRPRLQSPISINLCRSALKLYWNQSFSVIRCAVCQEA